MEHELCEPKEHRSIERDGDGCLLPIAFKEYEEGCFKDLVPLMWEYYLCVNQEDLSEWEDLELAPGIVAPYQKVEIQIRGNLHKGVQFRLAYHEDRAVGFMMYNLFWDSIVVVHGMYILPEKQLKGVGKGLIWSLGDVKKVLFRTRKQNPPLRFLGVMGHDRIIAEDDKHIVREMDWQAHKAPGNKGVN